MDEPITIEELAERLNTDPELLRKQLAIGGMHIIRPKKPYPKELIEEQDRRDSLDSFQRYLKLRLSLSLVKENDTIRDILNRADEDVSSEGWISVSAKNTELQLLKDYLKGVVDNGLIKEDDIVRDILNR